MKAKATRKDGVVFIRIGGAWHNATPADAENYHIHDMCGGVECGCPICCEGVGVRVESEGVR